MANTELETFKAQEKRSNELWGEVKAEPAKFRMLTGDRPTGKLHIGHYFGSLQGRVDLQNLGVHTIIVVADYQAITDRADAGDVRDSTLNLVLDYLACGIDPEKTLIFNHSAVSELNQLMLPFLSLVTESELQRNPTVKAEHEASGRSLSGLLLTYPVHQACDILFCKSQIVPVGKDQLPHVEQTRVIARRFNERFGDIFPLPEALLSNAPSIPGVDGRKMSKSFGNAIELSASDDETIKIIKKAQTDSDRQISFHPENRPGVSALLNYAALVSGKSESSIASDIGSGGAGMLKELVWTSINDYFRDKRLRRAELAKDMPAIEKILRSGNSRASEIASTTLSQVRTSMHTFI